MKLNGNPYLHDAKWRATYAAASEGGRARVLMDWMRDVQTFADRHPAYTVHALEVLNRLSYLDWNPTSTLNGVTTSTKPERKRFDWVNCSDGLLRIKGEEGTHVVEPSHNGWDWKLTEAGNEVVIRVEGSEDDALDVAEALSFGGMGGFTVEGLEP